MAYELKRKVTISAVISLPYECTSCGHHAKATVSLEETHTDTQRVEQRDAYALSSLREASSSTGEPSPGMKFKAKDLVALAPCPSCGRHDANAVRANMRSAYKYAVVFAAVPIGISALLAMAAVSRTVGAIFGLIGVLIGVAVAAGVVAGTRAMPAEAAAQVKFDAP